MSFLKNNLLLLVAVTALSAGPVMAENLPKGAAAVVNGEVIAQSLVDFAVAEAVARGATAGPVLRQNIENDLIGAQLLAQRAKDLGLAKAPDVVTGLKLIKTNLLARELRRFWLEKNPASTTDMRKEYEQQVNVLKKRGDLSEYELAQIVVASESVALDLIKQANDGADFSTLAKTYSIGSSAERGGDMGWVLPFNITPEIGNVIVNLGSDTLAQAPIQTPSGWHIIKVKAKRAYAIPTYEESEQALTKAVQNIKWDAYLKDLSDSAVVQR